MENIIRIVVWAAIICVFAVVFWGKYKGKKKYEGAEFQTDPNWLENSIAAYPADNEPKKYFFHFDKEYMHQGHIVEDEQHQTVYEIKVLFNNGFQADETDFVNHILNRTHHHTIGKTVTLGVEGDGIGMDAGSTFRFDGEDVFAFLKSRGYDYRYHIKGLAYHIDLIRDGETVARIYSSNNGKNLFERSTPEVVEKAGGKGLYVLECAYGELDVTVLYALAFTRTEFDQQRMMHLKH